MMWVVHTQRSTSQLRLPWPWVSASGMWILTVGYLALVLAACLVALVHSAVSPEWHTTGVDAQVAGALAADRNPALLRVLQTLSLLGKVWVVGPLVTLVGVVAWRRTGSWNTFWLPVLAGAGGLAISVVVKFLVNRPRPPLEIATIEAFGPSYPSGHAIRATAVYAALAWLVTASTRRRAVPSVAWLPAVLIAVAVGFARLYEGAHWLVDVLVGYGIGAGWLLVVLVAGGLLPATTTAAHRSSQRGRHLARRSSGH